MDDILETEYLPVNKENDKSNKPSEFTVCMKLNLKQNKKPNLLGNTQLIKDGIELYKKKDLVSKEEIYITEKMAKEVSFFNL